MKISMISIGEIKNKNTQSMEAEYLKRLKPYIKVDVSDISVKKLASLSEYERKKKEALIFTEKLKKGDFLILLDENGQSFNTGKFASMLKKHMLESTKHL